MAETENKSLAVWQSTEIARKTDSDDRITKLLVAMWDLVDEQKVDPNQLVDFLRSTGFDNEIGLARRLLNDYQGHKSEISP